MYYLFFKMVYNTCTFEYKIINFKKMILYIKNIINCKLKNEFCDISYTVAKDGHQKTSLLLEFR